MTTKDRVKINTPRVNRAVAPSASMALRSGFSLPEKEADVGEDRVALPLDPSASVSEMSSAASDRCASDGEKSSATLLTASAAMQTGVDAAASDVIIPDVAEPTPEKSGDKFASCADSQRSVEQRGSPVDGGIEEVAKLEPPTVFVPSSEDEEAPTTKTPLQLAIERCTALGDKSDAVVDEKWSKRSAPILSESLNFLAAYEAASAAEQQASRKTLKVTSGVSREPNVDNLPVIAVYLCVGCTGKTRTKAQRKEWCRFATVVKVAAKASVTPENAAVWLEKKKLNQILAEWSAHKKADGKNARKPGVPKALKDYMHLAEALATGSKFHAMAKAELVKADAVIANAMAEAKASSASDQKGLEAASAGAIDTALDARPVDEEAL